MDKIERQTLFQRGDFTLNSGAKSEWKIECDSLTDADIEALAIMIRDIVDPFFLVVGVPRGGIRLERALDQYKTSTALRVLIVDDVLTTGGSMERERKKYDSPTQGVVVFARGKCPDWIRPVFQMPEPLWVRK